MFVWFDVIRFGDVVFSLAFIWYFALNTMRRYTVKTRDRESFVSVQLVKPRLTHYNPRYAYVFHRQNTRRFPIIFQCVL